MALHGLWPRCPNLPHHHMAPLFIFLIKIIFIHFNDVFPSPNFSQILPISLPPDFVFLYVSSCLQPSEFPYLCPKDINRLTLVHYDLILTKYGHRSPCVLMGLHSGVLDRHAFLDGGWHTPSILVYWSFSSWDSHLHWTAQEHLDWASVSRPLYLQLITFWKINSPTAPLP